MSWNELEFVSWRQFHQMAPPIMRLEVTRLGQLIGRAGSNHEMRNALVKVRYELLEFVVAIEQCKDGCLSGWARDRLDAAIVNVPLDQADPDGDVYASLTYVLDRLNSIQKRIDFIYV